MTTDSLQASMFHYKNYTHTNTHTHTHTSL